MAAVALVVVACGAAASRSGTKAKPKPVLRTAQQTAAGPATSLQAQFIAVVKKVGPAVVQIQTQEGLGSGVIFDAKGDIVTNHHVVGDYKTVRVTLANGKLYTGTVVNTFPPDDLAVVKISAPNLHPIAFAPSSRLQVGQIALAIGNPLGLRSSVTEGIVSAVRSTVAEGNGSSAAISQAVQTSAAINPGNSGGALVDLSGRLIGIPTLAVSDPQIGGAAAGIGFAIPSDTVKDIAGQIVKYGKVVNSHRAYLGVTVGDLVGGGGVYIGSVSPGGPADKAGIKAGDIVTAIAGKATPSTDALTTVVAGLKPGQTVSVDLTGQDGSKRSVKLTLGSFPGS
ncbi:MAG TPA: trypsin-like peptidase domain-containing protein [Gaiellaceae bacterium]|nr:trypsin-like peptidase domain-containing protein [Gaiellaceae bacterium]